MTHDVAQRLRRVAELNAALPSGDGPGLANMPSPALVDMSPEAVERRLRQVGELLRLCQALQRAGQDARDE